MILYVRFNTILLILTECWIKSSWVPQSCSCFLFIKWKFRWGVRCVSCCRNGACPDRSRPVGVGSSAGSGPGEGSESDESGFVSYACDDHNRRYHPSHHICAASMWIHSEEMYSTSYFFVFMKTFFFFLPFLVAPMVSLSITLVFIFRLETCLG